MSSVSVTPSARDITFDFNNSCNCCLFRKKLSPSTPVYVNTNGEAVVFTERKNKDQHIQRCISNIQLHMQQVAKASHQEVPSDLESIRKLTGVQLSLDKPPTVEDINKINEAVKKMFD